MKPPNLLLRVDRYMSAWVLLMEVGEQYVWAGPSVLSVTCVSPVRSCCPVHLASQSLEPLAGRWGANWPPCVCISSLRLCLVAAFIALLGPLSVACGMTEFSSFLCLSSCVFILCLFFTVILVEPQEREKMAQIYILCSNFLLWNVCNLSFSLNNVGLPCFP